MSKFKPILAVPLERNIPYADFTFWSFIQLAQQGYPFIKLPYTRVDIACNKFAQHLLESDFSHLIILGLDHIHPADLVKKFKARVEEDPNKLVIAGLNFRRGEPYDPLAFVKRDGNLYSVARWEENEVMKVDFAGTGTMCIAREVFERLPGPPWFYFDYSREAIGGMSEDMIFCKNCREHGIDIWLDTGIVSEHLTVGRINEDVFRAYLAGNFGQVEEVHEE